jgi:putative flippase GtrA
MASPAFRRYLLVGGSVYLFELLVIVLAQQFGAQPTVAVGISFWLGVVVSFGLQKIVTFGDRRLHHKVLVPQIIAIVLLLLFNFGFTVLLTSLLAPPLPAAVTRTFALGLTTFWNFYLYRTRIFRTDNISYTEL